jgi:hypothetical protein
MRFMNFLVHSYTCCSDRYASPYWTFIHRWISMGFIPSLLKKRDGACCKPGRPVVVHSCIVLPPVGHSSNHEYHCCQLTRQSSCVSNFYRTFKVFIWLSLVCLHDVHRESVYWFVRYVIKQRYHTDVSTDLSVPNAYSIKAFKTRSLL